MRGLGFDLADALAGEVKRLTNLLQGVLRAVLRAEAHLDDFLLARVKRLQNLSGLFLQSQVDDSLGGRNRDRRRYVINYPPLVMGLFPTFPLGSEVSPMVRVPCPFSFVTQNGDPNHSVVFSRH